MLSSRHTVSATIVLGALLAVALPMACLAADGDESAVKLGVTGAYSQGFSPAGAEAPLAAVALTIKRSSDTARIAVASGQGVLEVSADVKAHRSLSMVGVISTGLEARAHVDPSDPSHVDTVLYLEGKGAVGNILAAGRLFSVGTAYDASGPLGRFWEVSPVGVASSDYVADHAGLTGAGLGLKVRVASMATLSGDIDWGWSKATKSVLLGDLGCDFTGIGPGTLSLVAKGASLGEGASTVGVSYSALVGEAGSIKAHVSRALLPAAPASVPELGISGGFGLGTSTIDISLLRKSDSTTSLGGSVALGSSPALKLSAQYNLSLRRTLIGVSGGF